MDTIRCDEEFLTRLAEADSTTSGDDSFIRKEPALANLHAMIPHGMSDDYYKGLIGGLSLASQVLMFSDDMPLKYTVSELMRAACRRLIERRLPR